MQRAVVAAVVMTLSVGCGKESKHPPASTPAPGPAPAANEPAPSHAQDGPMVVRFDPRIELLSILQRLAGGKEYSQGFASPYRDAVDTYFARFRTLPAVAMTAQLRKQHGITFNAPIDLAIHVDDDWKPLMPLAPPPPGLDPRWKDAPIDAYLDAVRAFAKASNAAGFFREHKPYADAVNARFRTLLDDAKALPWFNGFFGARPKDRFVVVPGLLTGGSNYGARVVLPDGHEERYQVVMLQDIDEQGIPHPDETSERLLVHEMAHSYVNPVVDRHVAELAPSEKALFSRVKAAMAQQAYASWDVVVKESLVRATVVLFIRDHDGADAAKKETYQQMDRGFYWMPELVDLLDKQHEGGLGAAMPAVETLLETWAAAHPKGMPVVPFAGPINGAFSRIKQGLKTTVVVSKGQPALAAYVGAVRSKLMPKTNLTEATGATWGTLGGQAIIAVGSPAHNPVVAHLLHESGWKVSADSVSVGGKSFTGGHLVLIASRARTADDKLPVVVYAAADDADLVGVNGGVFHGPTDWVVARHLSPGKFAIVAQGNF